MILLFNEEKEFYVMLLPLTFESNYIEIFCGFSISVTSDIEEATNFDLLDDKEIEETIPVILERFKTLKFEIIYT